MQLKEKTFNILLIEDNPGDVRLTKEAFKEGNRNINLIVLVDGLEATQYLKKLPPFSESIVPDLILLDLNLPKKNGREVLSEIKSDPDLCSIPVIILTTSTATTDIQKCYNLHANCFINKPVDFECFHKTIRKLEDFWLDAAILPNNLT